MPINSIITQPAANSLTAAYRPIVLKVNAQNIVLGSSATSAFTVDFLVYENKLHIFYDGHTPEFCQSFFLSGFTITVTGSGSGNNKTFTIISTSPGSGFINVFVREPVAFELSVSASITKNTKTVTPPVVYCDVYFLGNYYKTISKTKFFQDHGADSDWQFDIQDPCQEILSKVIGPNGGNTIVRTNELMRGVQCKFRSSDVDSNGFVAVEDLAPIQATGSFSAVSGTGTASNSFYVINSTLQHINNQDVGSHLSAFKANTSGVWATNSYPLTHRPLKYLIGLDESDYYPFVYTGGNHFNAIRLFYRYRGNVGFSSKDYAIDITAGVDAYYLPSGIKNLRTLFNVTFRDLSDYYLQVIDNNGDVVMTTCYYQVDNNVEDKIRLHFLTYTGAFDAITFVKPSVIHESTDSSFQNSSKYPLSKTDFGTVRTNVKSNDTTTGITKNYLADAMDWMQELFDSPVVYEEWKGIEGQADSYIPVVMINGKFEKVKNNGQYEYVTAVQYKFSNEYQTIRN